ncbi:hypothetical protein [Spirosoma flavus]
MTLKEMIPHLRAFAKQIKGILSSVQYVQHIPDATALINACYQNVDDKVAREGGYAQYGWHFSHKFAPGISEVGYLVATNHAVWCSPQGKLIDVTPFHPNPRLRPLNVDGKIFFLADNKAAPDRLEGYPLPNPMKFFALNTGKKLKAYIEELTQKEEVAYSEYSKKLAEQIAEQKKVQINTN